MTMPTAQELMDRVEVMSHLLEGHETRIAELEERLKSLSTATGHLANAVNTNADVLRQSQEGTNFMMQNLVGAANSTLSKQHYQAKPILVSPQMFYYDKTKKSDIFSASSFGSIGLSDGMPSAPYATDAMP